MCQLALADVLLVRLGLRAGAGAFLRRLHALVLGVDVKAKCPIYAGVGPTLTVGPTLAM